jgi:hypothetical protein
MAKGFKCPSCGELKFQTKGAVRICSACGAVGWTGKPTEPGAGRGKECELCGGNTVRTIYENGAVKITHCYNCEATGIVGI